MVKGRRQARRQTALAREVEARESEDRARREAQEHASAARRLARKWGNGASGLDRLSVVSRDLETHHREEARLLHERDELVAWLRREGESWAMLSPRTKLSRRALMKRMNDR